MSGNLQTRCKANRRDRNGLQPMEKDLLKDKCNNS